MIFGRGNKVGWQTVDMHCHILPGLDDGAHDLIETISMLRLAVSEGISDMVVTPHFHAGRFTTTPEVILRQLEQVQKAAAAENIPIRLYPGSEVYYFDDMLSCLRQQRLCTMNGSMYVLVEFSPSAMFRTLQNSMDRILNGGYQPILAHVERYTCLLKDMDGVMFLHNMGVRIQVNASTVTGKGGAEVKRFAHRLLKGNVVDFIGTDAHGSVHRLPEIARCQENIIKKYGEDYAYQVLHGNAKEMLGL